MMPNGSKVKKDMKKERWIIFSSFNAADSSLDDIDSDLSAYFAEAKLDKKRRNPAVGASKSTDYEWRPTEFDCLEYYYWL